MKTWKDDLEQEYNVKGNEHYVDIPENRILVGVMRVGDFAKGFFHLDKSVSLLFTRFVVERRNARWVVRFLPRQANFKATEWSWITTQEAFSR